MNSKMKEHQQKKKNRTGSDLELTYLCPCHNPCSHGDLCPCEGCGRDHRPSSGPGPYRGLCPCLGPCHGPDPCPCPGPCDPCLYPSGRGHGPCPCLYGGPLCRAGHDAWADPAHRPGPHSRHTGQWHSDHGHAHARGHAHGHAHLLALVPGLCMLPGDGEGREKLHEDKLL